MKKLKQRFQGLKLNMKFTIIIIGFVVICMAVLSGVLFFNMEQNVIRQQKTGMEYNMEKNYAQILKNIDSINMSAQFFLNDTRLFHFIRDIMDDKPMQIQEMLEFYQRDIASLERMVNNNPYLYQIRVYVDQENMQEMMPILFGTSRMKRLSWAQDTELEGWKFDYADQLFEDTGLAQQKRYLSLVTKMKDLDYGTIGFLEVSMDMETMFPGLYEQKEDTWSCFYLEDGTCYMGKNVPTEAMKYMQTVFSENAAARQKCTYYTQIGREKLIVGYQPLKEMKGTLISIYNVTGELEKIYRMRTVFILFMILLLVFLAIIIHWIVKGILRKFYVILHSIRCIQNGNLDTVLEDCGTDEMGELGNQINKMMDRIRQLMEDNVKREVLVKNSEIRALQNQINAHFIYNVLESIKMMAEIDEKYEISDAITALGRLLRYSMKWESRNVTVREEVEYIRNYLTLINLRFDYEIHLSLTMPDEIMNQEIPKMSLQPLIENAIYHGIEQLAEDTAIHMKGYVEDGKCVIVITDAGKGMSEEELSRLHKKIAGEIETSGGSGNGIGLKNVQDRIRMNFGQEYGIQIASRIGCYTKVIVKIPMQEKKITKDEIR